MNIKFIDDSTLFHRLNEIDDKLKDFHISAYRCDLLFKEQNEIKTELRKRGYYNDKNKHY